MDDMSMIERVAKAICVESGHTWEDAGQGYRETCTDFARAAIEAMRGPTTDMQWAGYRAKDAVFSADALWNRDPANCFNAMIDAALSPASEGTEK